MGFKTEVTILIIIDTKQANRIQAYIYLLKHMIEKRSGKHDKFVKRLNKELEDIENKLSERLN